MNKMQDVPAEGSAAADAAGEDASNRRARVAAPDTGADGTPSPGSVDGSGASAPRRRARGRRSEAQEDGGVDLLLDLPGADAPAGSSGADRATDDAAAGGAAEGAGPADARRQRGERNRRRGRRGRGERAPAGAPEGENGDAEGGDGSAVAPRVPRPAPDAGALFAEVVSGAYDQEPPPVAEPADPAAAAEEPAGGAVVLGKRVLRPEPEAPKLHKVLAQSGIGSRRDMEQLILDGKVTVNGEPAHIGMRIAQGDRVAVGGKPVKVRIAPPPARVLAYHKPVGEVVTFNDPEGRPTVFRNLPRLPHGKWQSVGRLDINTEGLLLFTTSGDLANQLMHPRFGVEREYAVRVLGDVDAEARHELLEGVEIDGQRCAFRSIDDGTGEGANRWYRVVITEGRHREVRRMFEEVGLVVNRLIRIRYGVIVLPKGLRRGEWVELDEDDVRDIRRLAQSAQPQSSRNDAPRAGLHGKAGRDRNRGKQRHDRNGSFGAGGDAETVQPPAQGAHGDDFSPDDPLHIPNPLEQTFDRRFATGSKRITAGFGRPSDDAHRTVDRGRAGNNKSGPKQPDPMQTSVGYIGADAYFNKPGGGGRRRGGGRGR